MKKQYSAPAAEHRGSLHQKTLQSFNKVGPAEDIYSATVPIVGSITPTGGAS